MVLLQLKKTFSETLNGEYPEGEINSFFTLLADKFLQMSRLEVALNPEREISSAEEEDFQEALRRLQRHEPIQYIIGETIFFGLPFKVNEKVLIPRPETEELVEWILVDLQEKKAEKLRVMDIGTGSGCIAVSLAKHLPNAQVTAIDISEAALETARVNAEQNRVEVRFVQRDILSTQELDSQYDIIVSNPPYVRELEKKEMQRNVLEHEPGGALYVKDEDPLVFYDKITLLAKDALSPGGALYFEINQYLATETAGLLTKYYFSSSLKKDIFGNDRMLKGVLSE